MITVKEDVLEVPETAAEDLVAAEEAPTEKAEEVKEEAPAEAVKEEKPVEETAEAADETKKE